MSLEELKKIAEKSLSSYRYKHSLGVMNMCAHLSSIYNVDKEKAMKVGIMHDIAKEMTDEEYLKYFKDNNIKLTEEEQNLPYLYHGIVAADICKKKFNFDNDMTTAIRNHTISSPNMTALAKILFVADKIEEGRDYPSVDSYRTLAYKDIDACIIKIINYHISMDIKNNTIIPSTEVMSRNYILK